MPYDRNNEIFLRKTITENSELKQQTWQTDAETQPGLEMFIQSGPTRTNKFSGPVFWETFSCKGKEEYLYSAIYNTHSLKVLRHGSHQFYLQITPCLPVLRQHSPDGATPNRGSRHPIAAYYLFIDLEGMKGWVGKMSIAEIWPVHVM